MDMLKFFMIIRKLKDEKRRGWVLRGIETPESVADHSYMTAVMCMLLADDRVDRDKVIKMALAHDMGESIIGDLTPDDIGRESKHVKEKNAMIEITSLLPDAQRKEIMNLWTAYNEGKTNEAIFVKDIDLLELAMQVLEYEKSNSKKYDIIEKVGDRITTKALRLLFNEIKGMRK
ncbi:MAG: HD domain-containing protein [Candidatus Aenigmarchaeota archaeon]|nr:HD domain-containing protein [Candidatus Aenigmarchaeota archaeon]